MLLTHALALSASPFFSRKSPYEYALGETRTRESHFCFSRKSPCEYALGETRTRELDLTVVGTRTTSTKPPGTPY